MNAFFKRRRTLASNARTGATSFALNCACNVYCGFDRHAPEAVALADWLSRGASSFGLSDGSLPAEGPGERRRLASDDWRKLGMALEVAGAHLSAGADEPSERWIAAIGEALELDPPASMILALVLYYKLDQRVERLFDAIGECRGGDNSLHRDADLMSVLLGRSTADVAARLTLESKLFASGLLRLNQHGEIIVLDQLLSLVRRDIQPTADIHGQLLGSIEAQPLPWRAFTHLGREADIAADVLRAAIEGGESGIGILLYGPPGTGKTSFAATLAERAGGRLRSIGEADDVGDEPSRDERLASLRLAQRLSAPGVDVLLFDEAEDLFATRGLPSDEAMASSRVFIHRLLERLPIPVIWTANDIGALGPAVLRRMTMCLELKIPDLATRTNLWRSMAKTEGIALEDADAARLARLVPAAPAVAATALRATRLAGGGAETARLIVEGVARAVRGGNLPPPEVDGGADYDAALVNADCDLDALETDLLRPGAPRAISILLSGPPGAGKSAWIRHLAGRMGMPVLQRRGSDLLDKFLGETERNIAGAFAEAREARAFLVFDEADSLLLERADATRSWEISQVNEMLTWMETHPYPFACTTNLLDRLDRASLRRFLVKLRFDWMTAVQARLAFRGFFGLDAPAALDNLRTLTPADFALTRRRAALGAGEIAPATALRLLAAESEGRANARLPVGFARLARGQ